GVRSSATPPARRRLDIRPAAISSIRRDRLPVWLEPAGAASPLAEAPAGGAAAAGGSGAAAGLVGVVEAVTEATDGGDHVSTQLLADAGRSEEHTSELQSRENLVCRLLLEKKKK